MHIFQFSKGWVQSNIICISHLTHFKHIHTQDGIGGLNIFIADRSFEMLARWVVPIAIYWRYGRWRVHCPCSSRETSEGWLFFHVASVDLMQMSLLMALSVN